MKIINKKLSELTPYDKNAKLHDKTQIQNVAESIRQYGFVQPIVIDRDGVIVIGHCRYEAAKKLKMTEVPCVCVDDLTPEQVKALRIVDNKTNESPWDIELLTQELDEIDLSGFDFDFDLGLDDEEEVIEDEPPEVPDDYEPISRIGDVWQLGTHRLMCGDSTDSDDVEKLMNGSSADMVLTDPPYNVNIENSQGMTIENDNMDSDSFQEFLTKAFSNIEEYLKAGGVFYIWFASREHVNFETALNENNLVVREELIWNKNSLVMGRQDYQWKHEPCLYGWKDGAKHLWNSDRKQTTVMNFDKPKKNDLHPTMKPVKLFDYQIKNSSKPGNIVLDLFGGSGTTIIACEQNGRIAYLMEYDPKYVDVIIKRWEDLTGKKAELISSDDDIISLIMLFLYSEKLNLEAVETGGD